MTNAPQTTSLRLNQQGRLALAARWSLLRPIWEWFFGYPLIFAETVGLLLIVLAEVWDPLNLQRLGLSSLFWHESTWVQMTAGVGIALVLGEVCLVGYLLDARRASPWCCFHGEEPHRRPTSFWYFFATGTYPLLVLLAALPAVFWFKEPHWLNEHWALPAGLLAGSIAIFLLSWFGGRIQPENSGWFDWLINLPQLRDSLPDDLQAKLHGRRFVWVLKREDREKFSRYFHLHAFQAFVMLALFALWMLLDAVVYVLQWAERTYREADFSSGSSVDLVWFISPALVICVLTALITAAYGFIMFHFPVRHYGVFCLIVLAILGGGSIFSRQIRIAGLDYGHPSELSWHVARPAAANGLLDNEAVLKAWRSRFPETKRPVLVVMAVKGGGMRSAAWTTLVLSRLEQELPALPYHTRLISGVSGGMVGATYYVATLDQPVSLDSPASHSIPRKQELAVKDLVDAPELAYTLVDRISRDSLSPVARHLALPLRGDRGQALEQAWEQNTHGVLARPFAQLREAERAGWCPSLVYSPMLVEDGRRLVISNLNLGFLVSNNVRLLTELTESPERPAYSLSGFQFFDLFPYATDMRLSSIARMNASFPYITPEAELPTTPPRRVVDAAYYDGYGVNVAALWIYHCRQWIRANTAGVVLVQIRDQRPELNHQSGWSRWQRALSRFTTPLEAAWHGREASMSFRNDELLAWLDEEFNASDPEFFTTVVFESPVRAPLSWYLPPKDLRMIKEAVQQEDSTVKQRIDLLKQWWARHQAK